MARRDWWMGIAIVAFAIIVHAFVSRFEWRTGDGHPVVPVDPRTGRVQAVQGDPQPLSPDPRPAAPGIDAIGYAPQEAPSDAAFETGTFRLPDTGRPAASRGADPSSLAAAAVKPAAPLVSTERNDVMPARARMPVVPAVGAQARPALLAAAAVDCTIDQSVRQRSGAEAGRRHQKGLGRLRIKNGLASDTVAVLVNAADGAPRRAMFIRARQVGIFTSLPSGRYRLRFQRSANAAQRPSDSGWPREGRLCRRSGTSEFDEPLDFFEIDSDSNTQYVAYDVTLNPVVVGTARTHTRADSVDGGQD